MPSPALLPGSQVLHPALPGMCFPQPGSRGPSCLLLSGPFSLWGSHTGRITPVGQGHTHTWAEDLSSAPPPGGVCSWPWHPAILLCRRPRVVLSSLWGFWPTQCCGLRLPSRFPKLPALQHRGQTQATHLDRSLEKAACTGVILQSPPGRPSLASTGPALCNPFCILSRGRS